MSQIISVKNAKEDESVNLILYARFKLCDSCKLVKTISCLKIPSQGKITIKPKAWISHAITTTPKASINFEIKCLSYCYNHTANIQRQIL